MQRALTHQIDEEARRVLKNALPSSWVLNELNNDYGKDYHLELSDEANELTGTAIMVQLKGQLKAVINSSRTHVAFPLEKRYSTYYYDKVKDIPVFLVVVDVTEKCG